MQAEPADTFYHHYPPTTLAVAAKSNAVYSAWNQVRAAVKADGSRAVPERLRNAPTRLMKQLGHGQGYRYAHDEPGAFAAGFGHRPESHDGYRH